MTDLNFRHDGKSGCRLRRNFHGISNGVAATRMQRSGKNSLMLSDEYANHRFNFRSPLLVV